MDPAGTQASGLWQIFYKPEAYVPAMLATCRRAGRLRFFMTGKSMAEIFPGILRGYVAKMLYLCKN